MTLPFLFRPAALLFLCCLTLSLGCGKSHELVPVSGQLFVDDKPAEGALVTFSPEFPIPDDARFASGYPRGYVAADGRFTLTTITEGDGAPPGNYIVLVNWTGKSQVTDGEETQSLPDVFRGLYTSPEKSKLRAEVKAGTPEVPRIDLKSSPGTGS